MSLAYVYARGRCIFIYFTLLCVLFSEEMRSKWDFFGRNKLTFVCNNTFGYKNHIPDAKKMI